MISLVRHRSVVFLALASALTFAPLAAAAPGPTLDFVQTVWLFLTEQARPADVTKEGCQTNPDGKPCPRIVTPPPPAKPNRPRTAIRKASLVGILGAP